MADVDHDSDDNHEFQTGESGASNSFPMQCSALRKNGFVLIKDRPCKIVEMSTSKTGKHGHAKVHLVGIDIFTQKKYEDICPSTHNMMVPIVVRKEYGLLDVTDDGFTSLLDDDKNETRDDIRLPAGDLGDEIREKFEKEESLRVTVLKSMNEEAILSYKVENDKK
jgi:translation initiation factor 5A